MSFEPYFVAVARGCSKKSTLRYWWCCCRWWFSVRASLDRVLRWHVWMVFHPVRDLHGRSWFHMFWHEQVRASFFQHHASYCHCGLVYLPLRLLLWIFDG